MEKEHRCHACNKQFPTGTSKRRQYCDDACRKRQKRASERANRAQPSSADLVAAQNDLLQKQVSRLTSELAKVHDRAMGYRRETRALLREKSTLLDVRRNSLTHFHTQHQQLRATYRQAHLLVTRFGQHIAKLNDGRKPESTTWNDTENVTGLMLRETLPSDTTNASTLTQLVADTMTQLDDLVGLSHHLPRTRRDSNTAIELLSATDDLTTPTPDDVVSTLNAENDSLREELDRARATLTKQRQQMHLAKDSHVKLREQYAKQRHINEQLKADREHNKIVIKQWLILARELYRRTGGRPTEARHKEILATWRQYETWAKGNTQP